MQNEKTLLILRAGDAAPTTAAAEVAAVKAAREAGFSLLLAKGGLSGLLDENLFIPEGPIPEEASFRPGGYLGTSDLDVKLECGEKEWQRIGDVVCAHGITDVLVIGDRAGSAASVLLQEKCPALRVAFLPVDVTNSVSGTHHSLGYGSGGKKVAADISEIAYTITGAYDKNPACVYEVPETESGWLALSAAMGRYNGSFASDFQFVPEIPFDLSDFIMNTIFYLRETGKAVGVFSHGLRRQNGTPFYYDESMTGDQYGSHYQEDMNSHIASHVHNLSSYTCSYRADVTAFAFTRILSAFDKAETESAAAFAVKTLAEQEISFGVSLPAPGGTAQAAPLENFTAVKRLPEEFYDREAQRGSEAFLAYLAPLTEGEAVAPVKDGLPQYGEIALTPVEHLLPALESKVGFIVADCYEKPLKKQ